MSAQSMIPPYHLQQLTSNVKELLGNTEGTELYIGCSNGSLLRYAFISSLVDPPEGYQLLTHQSLPSNKPIEQIYIAASVEQVLVLSDSQVYFFSFPNLEPSTEINPIRHVAMFTLDETQRRQTPDRRPRPQEARLCILKRNAINLYTLSARRLQFRKEIQFPLGAVIARFSGAYLCIATRETYQVIDFESNTSIPLLPLSQVQDETWVNPAMAVISEDEFLIMSRNDAGSLGVFIRGADPVRGTLTLSAHPIHITCDYPYVAALLPNGSIEIYDVETQSLCQTLSPSREAEFHTLEKCTGLYTVPSNAQTSILELVEFNFSEPDLPDSTEIEEEATRSWNSSNNTRTGSSTPQETTSQRSSQLYPKKKSRKSPANGTVLAIGTDCVYGLTRSTFLQQVDTLIAAHKLKEVAMIAQEQQKKLDEIKRTSGVSVFEVETQSEEISYVYQRLGYQCLSETIFEDAGIHLFRGNVDPRFLVRLFPSLRGTLLSTSAPSLRIFSGLVQQVRSLESIETIIKNYTPHLKPNTRSAPPTSELRRLLAVAARDMLRDYLRKWKNKAIYSREPLSKEMCQIIDTIQAKLFAEKEETQELYALVDSAEEDIVLSEVEDTFIRTGQYNALLKLCQKRGDHDKVLEIWSKVADGQWTEEDIQDPLGKMINLLSEVKERELIQKWGLWLVQRVPEAGLKLLMDMEGKRSSKADDIALLSQLEAINTEAGQRFLEHLVLTRNNNDTNLHSRLANLYVDRLLSGLENEEVLDFFRDSEISLPSARLGFEYSIQNANIPFLNHLATIVDLPSNILEQIRSRCRTALFLQGSTRYDLEQIRDKLKPREDILAFEVAILDGKVRYFILSCTTHVVDIKVMQLGRHMEALQLLVHTLRDTSSADAYCALVGCAISPRVAQFLGEKLQLQPWASLVTNPSLERKGRSPTLDSTSETATENMRRKLLRVLLQILSSATETHTARLLNAQGGKLDVLDILSTVPSSWTLNALSSFLARSMRQSVHEKFEGQILKSLCLGQNLEVQENAYSTLLDQGAIIEEPIPGQERQSTTANETEPEEVSIEKKLVIAADTVNTTDIIPNDEKNDTILSPGLKGKNDL
ncbi:hypothetical protein Clacol_009246 [Clathrus columnatus]|uniref:CNH domain-containing protein n=1 Tax=Clathrus columnatus TaxID=1419009 RepID=A0AAV5ARI6_9AGAM|nr:hypothetical protein Clacol_009246 [Clathrus columnatus]